MHMNPESSAIQQYISSQRQAGATDEAIQESLRSSGWSADLIAEAFGTPATPAPQYPSPQNNQAEMAQQFNSQPEKRGLLEGRLSRLGFLVALGYIVLFITIPVIVLVLASSLAHNDSIVNIVTIVLGVIVFVAGMCASVSAHVRRWHDLDQTGWLALLAFVPFIGTITILILFFAPGTPGANKYDVGHQASLKFKDIYPRG